MLVLAVLSITSALVFYSIGVWSEKIQGNLKRWHLCMFWVGFIFDTIGTTLMTKLANDGFNFNFHGIIGIAAIILMFIHAVWATKVLVKNNSLERSNFHKLSIIVWLIWLVPFVSGAIFGMAN